MDYSIFDLFKIGIGPSSSHTVGPMKASYKFLQYLEKENLLLQVDNVVVELFGSLALTGTGHGIERAIVMGLSGEKPEEVDPVAFEASLQKIKKEKKLNLLGKKEVPFILNEHLIFNRKKSLEFHPNAMTFKAKSPNSILATKTYYSVGGGFVQEEHEDLQNKRENPPYIFKTAKDLFDLCEKNKFNVSDLVMQNEIFWHGSKEEVIKKLDLIWQTMAACVLRGQNATGKLPGSLKVKRRANETLKKLEGARKGRSEYVVLDPLEVLDWVNLYALAVNEENADGGRVVTAPTNGAAGIIPAVGMYYSRFCQGNTEEGIHRYLLTSGAVAALYKQNASISGAEVGCQGEVGVACSMAAAGLTEILGGSPAQVENAAEIAMEHNLGLTCDPVGGLVQIPCIERNAMGAVKAINATRMALKGDGSHFISLDKVIKTMRQTGLDMRKKYKETSQGGLAVNWTEC